MNQNKLNSLEMAKLTILLVVVAAEIVLYSTVKSIIYFIESRSK